MAIYHFNAKVISRGQGRGIVAAAAYRAGECLFDDELNRSQNFLAKQGVVYKEIMLPDGAPGRWLDRATLWNEVAALEPAREAKPGDETAKDDPDPRKRPRHRQLAREVEFSLPRELSQAEAIHLAQAFVREQFVARGMVADLTLHWVAAADGHAQPHAHVLLSLRGVDPSRGFGRKERAWNERTLLGRWRERWAEMVNARLAELGHDVRVDHRSNAAQGLGLEPANKLGPAASRRAREGEDGERTIEHRAIAWRNGERMLAEPELALQALTHQHSTFTRADLARLVNRHSDGAAQFAAVMARVEASPELVRLGEDGSGRARFSTREMVRVEQQMIAGAMVLNGRTTHRVDEARRVGVVVGKGLSEEQHVAFGHVTRSRDLAVVVGIAGGGKSTMLGVAREVWAGQGYQVRGAALSGIAAEGLEGSASIASRTIASWEYAWDQGRELLTAADVLVVDEAGMIGSRQLGQLMARVRQAGAKLVLVGDAEQLQAIEAGAAFRAVADQVGVVAITEPRRQRHEWQRRATKELATARSADALRRYEAAGMVHGHATREAARGGVVAGWHAARRQSPHQSQIILAHERVDVRALNEAARAVRRATGELGPDHALQAAAGLRRFATGDRLYFLRNEREFGVKNGTLGTVERIENGAGGERLTVRLDGADGAGTGRAVSFDLATYADIDHGYAATVHKSQGITVDQAHVLATPGMDRHLVYVAMSRHRQVARLHWGEDEFGGRPHAVLGRERAKDTTLDYAGPEPDPVAAYAERRALTLVMPTSKIVVRPVSAAADGGKAKDGYDPTGLAILEGLTPPRRRPDGFITEDLPDTEPPPDPKPALPADASASTAATTPPRGMFDGLRLSAAPLSMQRASQPPQPEATPLAQALTALFAALDTRSAMERKALPVLPHQGAAVDAAARDLEALRPGSIQDLREVGQEQPGLLARPPGAKQTIAPLIAAMERRPAERKREQEAEARRKAEDAARQAEHQALAPARARLLRERMTAWWRTNHPYARPSDYGYEAKRAEANKAERVIHAEIETLPAAELRQTAAALARADRQAAQEASARPGPSPSPF